MALRNRDSQPLDLPSVPDVDLELPPAYNNINQQSIGNTQSRRNRQARGPILA